MVLLTENSISNQSMFRKHSGNDDLIFSEVYYSMNELNQQKLDIIKKIETQEKNQLTINRLYVDEMSNRLVLAVESVEKFDIKTFMRSYNIESVILMDYVEMEKESDPLEAGDGITGPNGIGGCTLGFAATRNGVDGFVTAAHCYPISSNVEIDGVVVGHVTARQEGGNLDTEFVESNSNFHTTNDVVNGYEITGRIISTLPTNATVYLYGNKSQLESGTITANSVSDWIDGVWQSDFYTSTYSSQRGDSGGPIMYKDSGGEYSIAGIHMGAGGMFIKYHNMSSGLDVVAKIS